jgi:hypothetical protein
MMRIIAIAIILLAFAACQSEGPRFTSEDEGCSFSELSGWKTDRAKGSLLLRDPDSRATIAVRAVAASGDWVEERTPALVNPAVRRVLGALPQARVEGPTPVRAGLDGASFEVSFVPEGQQESYLRRHVVLYGEDSGRVFHIVLTVPEATAETGAKAFDRVVDSFREEV